MAARASIGLRELRDWFEAERPQLFDYTIQQALSASHEWHQEMKERATTAVPDPGEVVYQWADGWTVHNLTTKKQLDQEGCSQGHCVGSYYDQVHAGHLTILSLRRPDGMPVLTIELQELDPEYHGFARPGEKPRYTLIQAKGWGNRIAGEHGKRFDERECTRLGEIMFEWNVRQYDGTDVRLCEDQVNRVYDAGGRRLPDRYRDPSDMHYFDEDGVPLEDA